MTRPLSIPAYVLATWSALAYALPGCTRFDTSGIPLEPRNASVLDAAITPPDSMLDAFFPSDAIFSTDAPSPDAPPVCYYGVSITIGNNHGHEMVVPVEDIEAGVDKTYQIQGVSAHPHTVTLTAAHYEMLAQGMTVTVVSSNDGAHTHDITLVCQ